MRIYPAISKLDVEEYDRIRNAVIAVLKKRGLYEPDIDELIICEIASNVIYSQRWRLSSTPTQLPNTHTHG